MIMARDVLSTLNLIFGNFWPLFDANFVESESELSQERGERMAFMIAEGTANGLDLEAPL